MQVLWKKYDTLITVREEVWSAHIPCNDKIAFVPPSTEVGTHTYINMLLTKLVTMNYKDHYSCNWLAKFYYEILW